MGVAYKAHPSVHYNDLLFRSHYGCKNGWLPHLVRGVSGARLHHLQRPNRVCDVASSSQCHSYANSAPLQAFRASWQLPYDYRNRRERHTWRGLVATHSRVDVVCMYLRSASRQVLRLCYLRSEVRILRPLYYKENGLLLSFQAHLLESRSLLPEQHIDRWCIA